MPSTAAASNVPVGTAGAANAPTSTNDELVNKLANVQISYMSAQKEATAAQGKTNDTLTAIAQNHDGRISDLENGQETNTSDIANLKDGQETNTSDIAKNTNRIAELEEAVTTMKKATQNNTAPIDPADLPGTRLTYELDSKPAGDSILDEAATPVKPPAAKVTSGNAVTPQVTPRHYYSSKAADVVPPSSMKKPSTAVAVASSGGVPGGSQSKSSRLTAKEKKALKEYSKDAYRVNDRLRDGFGLSKEEEESVSLIIAALRKLPPHVGTVERGISLTEQQIARMKILKRDSTVFVERGFMSATKGSLRTNGLNKFSVLNCHMIIQSKSARHIKKYVSSSYKDEDEVLFAPDTRFKVKDIESVSRPGNVVIMMEEV